MFCVIINTLNLASRHYLNSLQLRHNECDGLSNYRCLGCLLNRLFRHRWNKTPKLHATGLCAGNSPMTSESPAQRAVNTENVLLWWQHHVMLISIWTLKSKFYWISNQNLKKCLWKCDSQKMTIISSPQWVIKEVAITIASFLFLN